MEYAHIGWCKTDTHDKVWGIIQLSSGNYPRDNKYVTFWGRRGSKLQTKLWEGQDWDASKLFDMKLSRGYQSVDLDELNTVYPEFQQDLEKTAVWAMLKG